MRENWCQLSLCSDFWGMEIPKSTIKKFRNKLSEGNNAIVGNNARFPEKVLVRELFARWCSYREVRVKLSIETNFQASTANTVPVISIQNKIVNNSFVQTKIWGKLPSWKNVGNLNVRKYFYTSKKACFFYFSTMYFNFMEEEKQNWYKLIFLAKS